MEHFMEFFLNHITCHLKSFSSSIFTSRIIFCYALLTAFIPVKNCFANQYFEDKKHFSSVSSDQLFLEAKSILIDGFPGEEQYAQILLTECIRKNPKYVDALLELSKLIHTKFLIDEKSIGDLQTSLTLAYQAYFLEVKNPRARFRLAELLFDLGNKEVSKEIFTSTILEFPDHPETLIQKAKIFSRIKPEEALHFSEIALEKGVQIDDFLFNFIQITKSVYGEEKYLSQLNNYAKKYNNRWLWHRLGMLYIDANRFDEGEKSLRNAIHSGNEIESRLQLAVLLYSQLKKYKQAIEQLEQLKKIIESRPFLSKNSLALINSHLAVAYMKNENENFAKQALINITNTSIKNKDYLFAIVNEFKKLQKIPILEDSFKILMKKEPGFILSYKVLSDIFIQQKKYTDAVRMSTNIIILEPGNSNHFSNRAQLYYQMKDYEDSLVDFNEAIKIDPHFASAIYNKACVLSLLGKYSEALNFLKKAILHDESFAIQARTDKDFTLLKNNSSTKEEFASLVFKN